jgi:hypothetical protein
MPIVSQFAPISHSLFPPYPLLPAPTPRLLLPAPKLHQKQAPISITYTHAQLANLTESQRECLIHAMTTLLDVSVGVMLELLNLDAFRAAQVSFSREITGTMPPAPNSFAGVKAEFDAAAVEHFVNLPRQIAATREQAAREFDALLKSIREANDE